MNDFSFYTITQLQEALATKRISVAELYDYCKARFAQYDSALGSALEIFGNDSYTAIQKGSLYGIPGLVKDNICQQDRITSCSSKILKNFRAPYNATALTRLHQAGAYSIGRANCDEFAMGSSTETSAYHKTKNPWNHDRVPGGSSGGSIAAVAAGLVPWALGSETGGSVRQPASLCGIVGLKPTYGSISRYGLVAYASSFDQIGIATRTVKDNALVYSAIAGHDPYDSTTLDLQPRDYTKELGQSITGLTIGVIDNALYAEGVDPEIVKALEQAIQAFEKLGVKIKKITLPSMDYSAAVYFILSRAEAASNLARFDGVRYGYRNEDVESLAQMYAKTRQEGFGSEVKARILIGNYVLSVGHADKFYNNAKKAQALMRADFIAAFKDVDLLLSPVNPMTAFKFNAFDDNKLQMDLQDYFTCGMNITGIPALAVPCGFSSEQLPIGMQLIGPHLSEQLLFNVAHAYEQATPWHTMHPKGY